MHEPNYLTGLVLFTFPLLFDTEAVLVLKRLLAVIHLLAALIDQCRCLIKLMLKAKAFLQLFLFHLLQC